MSEIDRCLQMVANALEILLTEDTSDRMRIVSMAASAFIVLSHAQGLIAELENATAEQEEPLPPPRKYKYLLEPEHYEFYTGRSFEEDVVKRFEKAEEELNNHRCAYCGEYAPDTRDHVFPKSRGGSNDPDNLVWACRVCNSRKGARTPEEAGMPILFVEESRVSK